MDAEPAQRVRPESAKIDLLTVLDALDLGVVVANTRLDRVYHCNLRARQILAELGETANLPRVVVERLAPRLGASGRAFLPAVRLETRQGTSIFVRARLAALRSPRAVLTLTLATVREQELGPSGARRFGLSARHASVIRLVQRGYSNREIAGLLGISPVTVKHYLSDALSAIGARSRLELVSMTHATVEGEAA